MESIQRFKLYGLIYGFLFGFFIVLLYLTYQNTPETLPIADALLMSAISGLITGVVYWFYIGIIKADAATGYGDSGCSEGEYGGYDSGGGDSGGGGGD